LARRKRRNWAVGAGAALLVALPMLVAACGSGPSQGLVLSSRSGYPGQVINVSGNAGPGCVLGRNWQGFSFGPFHELGTGSPDAGGLEATMATPVAANGSWSATFVVPSYLPHNGTGAQGTGEQVSPGHYELWAPWCNGRGYATASFQVTSPPTGKFLGQRYVGIASTIDGGGYWLVQADGRVSVFGDAPWFGSLSPARAAQAGFITGIARTYDGQGYWLVGADGQVYTFGDARDYGPLNAQKVGRGYGQVTGIAVTPDGRGYWLASSSGRVYGFGDARSEGVPPSDLGPYTAIAARPAGGYLLVAGDNAASVAYPGGDVIGGGAGTALPATVVGLAATPSGNGAWLAAADGSVVAVGDAANYLSQCVTQCPSVPANQQVVTAPVTGIAATPSGQGYWLVGADGNVYNFGNAAFWGSGYR